MVQERLPPSKWLLGGEGLETHGNATDIKDCRDARDTRDVRDARDVRAVREMCPSRAGVSSTACLVTGAESRARLRLR